MLSNISTIFYDIMFGDINANIPMSKLETKVLEKVSAILNNPTSLSTHIPTPVSYTHLTLPTTPYV